MKAPFPWFGGKSRVAAEVWKRFGALDNYVEPFCGSCAVLLSNPRPAKVETVNDADCYVANFWRAARTCPEAVAEHADYPVSEVDLIARHRWLCGKADFIESMKNDPAYCDAQVAGWWLWGQCAWIGRGWTRAPQTEQLPHLGDPGMGVNRRLPHLGDPGRGEYILSLMRGIENRLRDVRIACGDWTRVTGPTVTFRFGTTGVFLDPPYDDGEHSVNYTGGGNVWDAVCEYAVEAGENPKMRVALCGYAGTFEPPKGWTEHAWKAAGGYGSQGDSRGRANCKRECVWFSPHCLDDGLLKLTYPERPE